MNHDSLSMRKAHGEMDTFLLGCGEMTKVRNTAKKTVVLLKFRHTQYAPFGASNCLNNKSFILIGEI